MIKVSIFRLEQTEQGALGSLVLNGELFCSTLEPDDNDPVRNQIPAGRYICKRFKGYKWPNTFEVLVEGHTAVLFHSGNEEEDSMMCVLLGQYPGKLNEHRAVLNSGKTFKEFMRRLESVDEFELEITDLYSIGVGS
jgi:hypothetical protein